MQSSIEHVGEFFLNEITDCVFVVSRAEMGSDYQFVFEAVATLYDIFEVEVTKFVYFLSPMMG